jgi:hypothetical protein
MPAVTIYLSRVIGVVALGFSIVLWADKPLVMALLAYSADDRRALLLLGLFRAVTGAVIVLIHNVWTRGLWPLVVTLVGWSLLVRGVMDFFVPTELMLSLAASLHMADFYYLYAALPLVVGAYLCLRGFSASVRAGGTAAGERR